VLPHPGQRPFSDIRLVQAAGIALLGLFWGAAVAVADLNALYLAASLVGCAFILFDFRVGVVLLVLLLPISRSYVFPHAMLGITGLNPFNLLLAATFGSALLQALFDGGLRQLVPRPLLWLYIVPMAIAALLGLRHVPDIAPAFFMYGMLEFKDGPGYLREMLVKPLQLVVFALMLGAAVARSARPERFLAPTLLSIWLMGVLVIVFVVQSGVGLDSLSSGSSRGFLSALGLHANDLGRLYAIAYALLLFTFAGTKDGGFRLALLATMLLVVVALVLTFSRGAYFGFAVVNVLFLLWRANARTLALIVLACAGAALVLPGAVYERMATGFGGGLNAISAGRIEGIWLPLVPDLLRNPLFGNGLGSILWSEAMRKTDGVAIIGATHPHNAYLQVFLDMGIAGLLLIGAYIFHAWKGFRDLSADPSLSPVLRGFFQGAAAGLVCFLLSAFTDSRFTPVPEQVFLWLAIGMMYGVRRKREEADGARK
jgi:O-antigen ligase